MAKRRQIVISPTLGLVRCTAVACVLFLLIASARGFFPAICVNLSAMAEAAANNSAGGAREAACCQTRHTCPTSQEDGESRPLPEKRACPFCNVTSALVEPLAYFYVVVPPRVKALGPTPFFSGPSPAPSFDAFLVRGPPVTS